MTINDAVPDPPPAEWLDGPLAPDAPAELSALYDEVAAHLRVPFLGPFWRALAWDQGQFARLWPAIRPLLTSAAFEREAASLRRAALIEEAVTMPSHQAYKADLVRAEVDFEMRARIANYNAAVHYALPKTLLVAAWLLAPPASSSDTTTDNPIPTGIAPGAVAVTPVPPQFIRGRLAELLEEIPRAHQHPIADEYFRALGRMTDYLNPAWNALKPIVRDDPYDERSRDLAYQAESAIPRLPANPDWLHAAVTDDPDSPRLQAVLTYFARRHLPDTLIDVAIVKGLTDGPDEAQGNAFELTS
ncbi:MAG: hypothetical protein ACRDJE_15890 [Dehalococcoidia bacterium]